MDKPKLGVSACLLGHKVRYNGDGAEYRNLTRTWSHHLELVGVCPEVGIGMGTPRPTIRLVKRDNQVHLVNPKTGDDFTQQMIEYAQLQSDALINADICGFVFKKDSPSCGLERVRVYTEGQPQARRNGTGLFALVFTTLHPHIPVIEEGRLSDPLQAEHFLARVEFFSLWLNEGKMGWSADRLMRFHNTNKLFLLSRSPSAKRDLGRLLARAFDNGDHPENVALEYMTAAQKSLDVLTKPGQSLMLWNGSSGESVQNSPVQNAKKCWMSSMNTGGASFHAQHRSLFFATLCVAAAWRMKPTQGSSPRHLSVSG